MTSKLVFRLTLLAALTLPAAALAQKFQGANKCKACHAKVVSQVNKGPHAKAFATLGTEQAKKIGAKMGVSDPQADAKCLKCHVTGHGDPNAASLKKEAGVQCESCHGNASKHVKARMASEEESPKIPAGEIVAKPDEKSCTTCHNKESPTFKPFKYAEAVKAIAHPNK